MSTYSRIGFRYIAFFGTAQVHPIHWIITLLYINSSEYLNWGACETSWYFTALICENVYKIPYTPEPGSFSDIRWESNTQTGDLSYMRIHFSRSLILF